MLSELIKKNAPIQSKINFSLKSGKELSGKLIEVDDEYVTLENENGTAIILIDMIGAFEVIGEINKEKSEKRDVLSKVTQRESVEEKADIVEKAPQKSSEPTVEAFKKLVEIDERLEAQLSAAELEYKEPEFAFPTDEFGGRGKDHAKTVWNRVNDRYQYALKMNELSAKFGRIQPITRELEVLLVRFPKSATLRRHLAFFYYLLGDKRQAISFVKDAVALSHDINDWYNIAVLAIESGSTELASYSLKQYFYLAPLTQSPNVWHVYIGIIQKTADYPALLGLSQMPDRNLQEKELVYLMEAGLYLLKSELSEQEAEKLISFWLKGEDIHGLIIKVFNLLDGQANESSQQLADDFTRIAEDLKGMTVQVSEVPKTLTERQTEGEVYRYLSDSNYGFINNTLGNTWFFHRSAVIDPTLQDQLYKWEYGHRIPVTFEGTDGPKGPIALRVTLQRTVDELFMIARESAKKGEYPQAIGYLRQVIKIEPEYPDSQQLLEKWRTYAKDTTVPRGSNPYARAKRAHLLEKDLIKAERLFRDAMMKGDNQESAIKDLASLFLQKGYPLKAVKFLSANREKVQDQQSVDNMLIEFYQKAKLYDEAVSLLQEKLEQTVSKEKRAQLLWQIGNLQLQKDNYALARQTFGDVLKLHPDNLAAQRNIAICFFKLRQFSEAKHILNRILETAPDAKSAELLDAIKQSESTGESTQIDEIIIETTLTNFGGEISGFTKFLLDRSDYRGVAQNRIQARKFDKSDIKRLEGLATRVSTKAPRERAGYLMSAAKITSIIQGENNSQFNRYLVRSFASSGDAIVAEGKPIDSAREFYSEALSIYDRTRSRAGDEQDAVNALVRFLYATLGQAQVPLEANGPSINETIEDVLNRHPRPERVFEAIGYLVSRSKYAANRILKRLYSGSTLQALAYEYLANHDISIASRAMNLEKFVGLWNELTLKKLEDARIISSELRFLKRVELTTFSLENGVERLKTVSNMLFFDLDRERCRQLQSIYESTLELVKQVSFEEQERLCIQVGIRCDDLLKEIEANPTKLSVEELLPVTGEIQQQVENYLEELYVSSIPQIELRLPKESYVPDNNQQIEVQIVAANKTGRSPAESLELILQPEEEFFSVISSEIRRDESLRGDKQFILEVPIKVTSQALQSQTFSLPMYAQYRTRSGETEQTPVQNFAIRLYPEKEFEAIDNPYAAYAEGGVVGDPTMFYGRDEMIGNITRAIQESRTQSKSIVVFGQKRSGKSSILYHLKTKLNEHDDLAIIDIGNIGSILDEGSSTPFLYQILWSILSQLQYTIEDLVNEKELPSFNMKFPCDTEFFEYASPLVKFKDLLTLFKRRASKTEGWSSLRLVLLIDEFSYIYGLIEGGQIPDSFMKNWKALLQENYFSVVLAGQDVMPKFKQRFPNEFGTTQDERVSYLRPIDATRLIDEPTLIGGYNGKSRFRERAIDRILVLTAGSPFYIQIVCDRLVRYMNEKRASLVTEADIEQVASELIRGVNALSLDKFDNLINSGDTSEDAICDEDALKVLWAIAVNSETGPCNRDSISVETLTHVDRILNDLVNREVIERERERYYLIKVGLFRDWLIAHR